MMGLGLLFVFIIPVIITIAGFRHLAPLLAFIIPFMLYAIIVPIFDSLWLQYNLLGNPGLIMLKIIGGAGFGIIGIGACRLKENIFFAVIIIVTGILIVLTNAPNLAVVCI
jgi:hypothetical protein